MQKSKVANIVTSNQIYICFIYKQQKHAIVTQTFKKLLNNFKQQVKFLTTFAIKNCLFFETLTN